MSIPVLPKDRRIVEKSTGIIGEESFHLSSHWESFFSVFINNLQQIISDQGIKIPSLSAQSIIPLATTNNNGLLIYNETTNQLQVNLNGVIKTITAT